MCASAAMTCVPPAHGSVSSRSPSTSSTAHGHVSTISSLQPRPVPRGPTGDPFAAGPDGLAGRVTRALERVGIGHLGERRVDTLSQGERQRVRIARALSLEPELLLLDEPFGGMDLAGRELLVADLDRLLAEPDGPTVVLVTHHLEELPAGIADVALVRAGRLVAHGPVAAILTDGNVSDAFGLPIRVREDAGPLVRGRRAGCGHARSAPLA